MLVGFAVLVIATLCGAPLYVVILGAAMLGFLASGIDLVVVGIELYRIADTPLLVALPLFTFAGYILAEANTSKRLMDVMRALFGWMPAGLAIVGFATCALFTALPGASGVTIVALGALLLPMLVQSGYSERFSLGLVTSSGSLGLLILPSVPLILYGIVAQQVNVGESFTIRELFLAGLVPALLMIVALSIWASVKHRNVPVTKFNSAQVWKSIVAARWELPLPIVILGGIYSGFFAISEAAAITALYALFVEVVLYKEVSIKRLPSVIRESMTMVGSIILILGGALALTNYFVDSQIPQKLFEFINVQISNPIVFLILLNLVLLVLGAILDIFSAIVIMIPLLLPVAAGYGIHPVHLGIIFMANMQIGYFTPPIGMNLFIASYRFEKPIVDLYRATLPFMAVLLIVLVLITYIPQLSLWYQHF
ncbi:MAG: TRAP transporter large permease subunit [Gammaproteobacteria bacterium]|nr:TRAP transporter large permease subunit [Gammaproteobacteria bacterium]